MTEQTPVKVSMDKITSLARRRGFMFQSSEIYGGLSSCWDYGPLGAELKRNVKQAWWRAIIQERDDVVGLDSSIIMHPRVWEASGHVAGFSDPLVECKNCHQRWRSDKLEKDVCPDCGGELTEPRMFNLMSISSSHVLILSYASITALTISCAEGSFAQAVKVSVITSIRNIVKTFFCISKFLFYDIFIVELKNSSHTIVCQCKKEQ